MNGSENGAWGADPSGVASLCSHLGTRAQRFGRRLTDSEGPATNSEAGQLIRKAGSPIREARAANRKGVAAIWNGVTDYGVARGASTWTT